MYQIRDNVFLLEEKCSHVHENTKWPCLKPIHWFTSLVPVGNTTVKRKINSRRTTRGRKISAGLSRNGISMRMQCWERMRIKITEERFCWWSNNTIGRNCVGPFQGFFEQIFYLQRAWVAWQSPSLFSLWTLTCGTRLWRSIRKVAPQQMDFPAY